jgi:hypothetical protein
MNVELITAILNKTRLVFWTSVLVMPMFNIAMDQMLNRGILLNKWTVAFGAHTPSSEFHPLMFIQSQ